MTQPKKSDGKIDTTNLNLLLDVMTASQNIAMKTSKKQTLMGFCGIQPLLDSSKASTVISYNWALSLSHHAENQVLFVHLITDHSSCIFDSAFSSLSRLIWFIDYSWSSRVSIEKCTADTNSS